MYNSDTELLFPTRIIPELRSLRSETWRDLVDQVSQNDPTGIEYSAFVLMMVRMSGCVTCNADSYRAMRGCTQCARQAVRRFRGEDRELVKQFEQAEEDVEATLPKKTKTDR